MIILKALFGKYNNLQMNAGNKLPWLLIFYEGLYGKSFINQEKNFINDFTLTLIYQTISRDDLNLNLYLVFPICGTF